MIKVLMISGDTSIVKNLEGPFALTLTELSKHWKRIDVLCPGLQGHSRKFNSTVTLTGVRKFLLFFDLFKILKANKYDLIVTHDYGLMLNGLSVFLLAKIYRIPQVSEIHHLEGYPQATSLKERIYSIWGQFYIFLFVSKMAAVRIDNQGDILRLLKSRGVAANRIVYLPPIYLDFKIYKPENRQKKWDLLFVGRLAQNKGIFTILEALRELRNQGYFLKVNLKGRGPLRQKILDFILHNDLKDSVFVDDRFLSEVEMAQLYNESRLLVCASTVEGGPRVTLEAMACDIPVISTPCGIMPEVIENGKNGYLFNGTALDLTEKIKSVLSDSNSKLIGIKNSVEKYDLNLTLAAYGQRYIDLVKNTSY